MLDLNDLQTFVQVVDHGGFTAASRATGTPKQTLSKRLAALETATGVRLIQRTSRSFGVTELGRDLYRHAAAMLVEAEAAENVIRGRLGEPSGTVRVTAGVYTMQAELSVLLPKVALAHPGITLVLNATDRFVDLILEGYDIAVRDHMAPLRDSGLVQRRLMTEDFWLAAAPAYLAGRPPVIEPTDLNRMDAVFSGPNDSFWDLHGPDGQTVRVTPRSRFCANDVNGTLAGIVAGLGVTAMPASICAGPIARGELVQVLPGWDMGQVTTTMLMPHRRGLLPSVRVVADAIANHLIVQRAPE